MAASTDNYIQTFRSAIARIFHANGAVVGGGFLVSGRTRNYILTCAHVVTSALSLPEDIVEAPSNDIYLDGSAPQKQRLNEIFNDFKEFAWRIERCLKELQFFKDNSRRLRVVIAARCLIDLPLDRTFPKLTLSPFNWEVIQDTATKYLKPIEMTSESLALLAAHLLYLTGGHPGGIAEALKVYRGGGYTVNLFLNSYGNQLWEKNLKKCRDQIRESLTKENNYLYESIEKLSIFPIINSSCILKEAVQRFKLPFSDDSFKLNTELTKTSIFTRDKTIIKDGMTRRLLVIGLLRESSPESFQELCKEAAEIC
ncbi:MAG: hypothetical protein V7K92_21380 [Nostoc sp.]|uniref:hypothetical protein n=1 Tax=Nostoc sp. TaxID=1180 RepID=UPI002FF1C575